MISEASKEAATDPQALNDLTRRLAHINALEEAKLAAKRRDAVIANLRGFNKGDPAAARLAMNSAAAQRETAIAEMSKKIYRFYDIGRQADNKRYSPSRYFNRRGTRISGH
ncbi:hypothetical protein FBEOM_4281 [Fusarium beomiforme]|uniref:Uncharacterized protein n=1 Tax=Fusarium beomiforme TaxID=44412 RepID=A0A9P5E022_9HYPO|nr:hypothetical protein FBEOM_4281 [Fusarium beomiforme]